MNIKQWFQKWNFNSLKINAVFLEVEVSFSDADQNAAWELYVEMLTRITTQPLAANDGDEATALQSVADIFKFTRDILKKYGPDCVGFAKVAIIILNQVIRPFTAKWHKLKLEGAFEDSDQCLHFRQELEALRMKLVNYSGMLSAIAKVEDLTNLEVEE